MRPTKVSAGRDEAGRIVSANPFLDLELPRLGLQKQLTAGALTPESYGWRLCASMNWTSRWRVPVLSLPALDGYSASMLREIHIQSYAVIDSLSVEFHPGLNLLSGETGSGKSIVVDALGLALGGRASPDVIRTGADRAIVTAVFSLEGNVPSPLRSGSGGGWQSWFDEFGITRADEIILRRDIQTGGRSRLLVNDQPVTVAAVRLLARLLVEVHGQNEHVALFARDAQLGMVDRFAGAENDLATVAGLYRKRSRFRDELARLSENEQERLRALDLLRFQAQELGQARLRAGEDAELEMEKQVLANLERVRAAASTAFAELYEDEGSACARLAATRRALDDLCRYDTALDAYSEPLAAASAAVEDLAFAVRDYLARLEANPTRLEEVEDRLALINRLKRKYAGTIAEMLAHRERLRDEIESLEHADERREQVRAELDRAALDYDRAARLLSELRHAAASKLEHLVRDELAQMGMEKARLEIRFGVPDDSGPAAFQGGARGIDEIELCISPNPGEDPKPIEKIASGGELSRLMLALKTVVGTVRAATLLQQEGDPFGAAAPTFVFDEVDAGIGGRVAETVGLRLKRLSRQTQVLCVTHLPQIACFADHHYCVEKIERGGRTVVTVQELRSQKERAAELARMLSGSQISDAVLKHAAAMLKQGATL